ncbi:hypothetical protein BMETH_72_2 [methanotrophic bacterial endosymbiont of Bathymodiolus sp.]|nr:hypothetical protein BMETH_72_2 [methanotrophic bacterial endosymbiont of Bathymodiolus sp.]
MKHALQLVSHFFHTRRRHDFNTDTRSLHFYFNFLGIKIAFA